MARGAQRAADAVHSLTHPDWSRGKGPDSVHGEALRRGAIGLGVICIAIGMTSYLPVSGVDAGASTVFCSLGLIVALATLLRPAPRDMRRTCWVGLIGLLTADGFAGWAHATGPGTIGIVAVAAMVWAGVWMEPWGPLKVTPLAATSILVAHLARQPGFWTALSATLIATVIGITSAEGVTRHSSGLRRIRAEQTATVAALSLENVTDDLTGVGNRRWGRELLNRLRPGDCVAMVDLDHFKAINDEHGHAVGDRLLRELGLFLMSATRGEDNVARIGGEEFVIVFPRTGASAELAAERLLAAWRQRRPLTTFSMGLCVHQRNRTADETLSLADAALYRAKDWGRNGMVMAGRGPGAGLARTERPRAG